MKVVWVLLDRQPLQDTTEAETSLVVQWLRLCVTNAGILGSILGQGTRSHKPLLRVCMSQLKIPLAAAKTQHSQINIY